MLSSVAYNLNLCPLIEEFSPAAAVAAAAAAAATSAAATEAANKSSIEASERVAAGAYARPLLSST